MDLPAWRLPRYQNAGVRMQLDDRPWTERQMLRADGAAANFAKQ
jgi:hypothetical protein